VFLTVSPDFVGDLGYTYRGSFNATIVVSSIAARVLAGKASDRYGRITPLIVGMVLLAIGMAVIASAENALVASIGGVLYGLSIGINMPTIFAWTVDFAREGKTALALGTMLMSLEIGIGLGAVVSGWIYGGDVSNIPNAYLLCVAIGLVGAAALFWARKHPSIQSPKIEA
jgi:MFS family permease